MEPIKGELKLLGNNISNKVGYRYSLIEIGDTILQDIIILDKLQNYLSTSLNKDGDIILYIHKNIIYGITTQDGKTYCTKVKNTPMYYISIILLIGSPPIGLILFIYYKISRSKINKFLKEMESEGAIIFND